jgi:hypothetical protein
MRDTLRPFFSKFHFSSFIPFFYYDYFPFLTYLPSPPSAEQGGRRAAEFLHRPGRDHQLL